MMNFYRSWRSPRLLIGAAAIVVILSGVFYYMDRLSADRKWPATCERPAADIIPSGWADKNMAPGNVYYEALFSDSARDRILSMPPAPVPAFFQGNLKQQQDMLSTGRLLVPGGPAPA